MSEMPQMSVVRPLYDPVPTQGAVAVLIDGENIPVSHSAEVLKRARTLGALRVRRVYGDATKLGGWEAEAGLDLVHTHCGKNSADMRLAIDAVDLAARDVAQRFVIVSSDGDFSHLAQYLREQGRTVVGLGEYKTPARFRMACCRFWSLPGEPENAAEEGPEDRVCRLIEKEGEKGAMEIALLGQRMNSVYGLQASHLPERNWRAFLTARTDMFHCDPKGPGARVRLRARV